MPKWEKGMIEVALFHAKQIVIPLAQTLLKAPAVLLRLKQYFIDKLCNPTCPDTFKSIDPVCNISIKNWLYFMINKLLCLQLLEYATERIKMVYFLFRCKLF